MVKGAARGGIKMRHEQGHGVAKTKGAARLDLRPRLGELLWN